MTLTDKPKPPSFTAAATAWLEGRKKEWIAMIAASPLADAALAYARQESWLLPYEKFHEVPLGKLFPSVDVDEWAKLIKGDGKTPARYNRVSATASIKAQAADDLAGHDAAILRLGTTSAVLTGPEQPIAGNLVLKAGEAAPATSAIAPWPRSS